MSEKDEGLLLTEEQRTAIGKGYEWLIAYKEELDYFLKAQLAHATPIIEKRQQEKDTAYYAEMMKEAIDRVRTETKKQERERALREVSLKVDEFMRCAGAGMPESAVVFLKEYLYEELEALKGGGSR